MPEPGGDAVDWDTGAIVGTGIGGVDTVGDWVVPRVNEGKVRRLGSATVEQTMASSVSACVGGLLGLGGQVTTNSSACTTGTEAVVDAFHKIREGRATRMIAGGAEGSSHYIWAGFDAMRVLARQSNDRPEAASRPMSATAGGFVPSSGAGLLMVESLSSARRAGRPDLRRDAGRPRELRRPARRRQHDGPEPRGRQAVRPRGAGVRRHRAGRRRRDQRSPDGDDGRHARDRDLAAGAGPARRRRSR